MVGSWGAQCDDDDNDDELDGQTARWARPVTMSLEWFVAAHG